MTAVLHLVPSEFALVPSRTSVEAAIKELQETLSAGQEVDAWQYDKAIVVGHLICGDQEIVCPLCGKQQVHANSAGFGEMLFVESAEDIEIQMPCCQSTVQLATLDLRPFTRFARFGITVSPASSGLSDTLLELLGKILGCQLVQFLDDDR